MKLKLSVTILFTAVLLVACATTSFASSSEICFPVELRGGEANVCVTIFENDKTWFGGATVLAVHGLTETAETWRPLSEKMFAEPLWGRTIKRVIALDLPGHGKSPIPEGLPGGTFGQLLIDDNMSVIAQTILALQEMDLSPRVIMGHSMGGLAIQGLQQALLDQDLSLAHLGILRAILLAPVPVAGSVWNQGPPSDLTPYIMGSETGPLGQYLSLPPMLAMYSTSYMTLAGEYVPNLPTIEEATSYNAPEPLWTLSQLTGASPLLPARPDAGEGAFSICKGTFLNVISFSQDVLVPAGDLDDLYAYLTSNDWGLFYRNVDTADACHGMYITNPKAVVDVLKTLPPF